MKESMEFFKEEDGDSSIVRFDDFSRIEQVRGGASRMVPRFKEWQRLPAVEMPIRSESAYLKTAFE
jgi:hypothetical protein